VTASTDVVDRLAAFPKLAALPRDQLEWLASRGSVLRLENGAVMYWREGDPRGTFIILEGSLSSRADRGGATRVVRELGPGSITGVLPYSRIKTPSAYTVAIGTVEMLVIDEGDLLDMIRECHDFTALCVHEMVDRTRVFRSYDLQQEKMAALGRLSAGLAHELGNPSSAIARSAGRLEAAQLELADAARALGESGVGAVEVPALRALESACSSPRDGPLSPLELAVWSRRIWTRPRPRSHARSSRWSCGPWPPEPKRASSPKRSPVRPVECTLSSRR
jgi:CRP-like cAMP-binding protein